MMEISGLWKKDYLNGQEGFTLAAALLLGKHEVIQQIILHYKIDALVRINNVERCDDRLYIQTNLVEAYEQPVDFVNRHLLDKFYLEGGQRVNLRAVIFREIAANQVIHREYTNAAPATFIIYTDRVETENANNPHGEGPIDPANFVLFPKNPLIAKFFIQLGRVEELGSGILTTNRLTKEYAGKGKAVFIEGETFKSIIPLPDRKAIVVNDTVKKRLVQIILQLNHRPGSRIGELAEKLNVSEVTVKRDMQKIRPLVEYRGSQKQEDTF